MTTGTPRTGSAKPGNRRQVFVAYPYRLYPKSDYRPIYKDIERTYDVTFIFADEKITNMHIMKKIESFIRSSDFSIFDISGWNPNVTLELGFAMALNDQWYIALDPSKTEANEVPSDLRGLDRIQYTSYSELKEKIQAVMAQRYPKRPESTIEAYLDQQRSQVVTLLRSDPGLRINAIADVLGVDVQVAKLIVRPLLEAGTLRTQGSRKGTKYYVARSSGPPPPNGNPVSGLAPSDTRKSTVSKKRVRASSEEKSESTDVRLNDKERAVLSLLNRRAVVLSLEEIGMTLFPKEPPEIAHSWARNSMRKLVNKKLARKVARGTYVAC